MSTDESYLDALLRSVEESEKKLNIDTEAGLPSLEEVFGHGVEPVMGTDPANFDTASSVTEPDAFSVEPEVLPEEPAAVEEPAAEPAVGNHSRMMSPEEIEAMLIAAGGQSAPAPEPEPEAVPEIEPEPVPELEIEPEPVPELEIEPEPVA
ncbi:MAG: hypothetical protein K5985_09055, partial [Lachnospiraceae bacterium]|nr:hypothetical protein [Lachnospiraceae bacterium]